MAYLSHILGKRVVDSVGQPMGRISDLAITVEEPFGGEFPPVTLVLVRAGSAILRLRWELIADLNAAGGNASLLDEPRAKLTIGQEKEGEVYLRRDVLDKQILDIRNYRMVRVNDIFLLEDDDKLRATALAKLEGYTNRELTTRLACSLATVERRLQLIRRIWTEEAPP